jgi:hypothetical protein
MEKDALKDILYGGVSELIRNSKSYRHSPIGQDYCKFTESGEVALKEFMQQMALLIYVAEEKELDKRAKDMVIRGLKGETL